MGQPIDKDFSMDKAIITAAITGGIHTPSMSPYLPITPQQIIDDAVGAWQAGAAIAHIHARDPETGKPSSDTGLFGEIVSQIKKRSDLGVCITTGGGLGQTTEERVAAVKIYSPELASLNAGSLNFALFLEKGVKAKSSAEQMEKILRIARELGVEPATSDEARQILNLKGLDKVRF